MSFPLKDGDKLYFGCFDELSENQFMFVATDFYSYFSEKINGDEINGVLLLSNIVIKRKCSCFIFLQSD